MGFYGNITNTSRTQFQFDKIYPNRYEMDRNAQTDGVYLGRYVLIEYDNNYHLDTFKRVFFIGNVAYLYNTSQTPDERYKLTKSQISQNELVYTSNSNLTVETGLKGNECIFYKCTSTYIANSKEAATFEAISRLEGPAYTDNYNIDKEHYNPGRGYDSTVWQKVFSKDSDQENSLKEHYVMIAELNSVVPTFDVIAEAPSMNPVVPHFDTESTDVYYKLHWQTPWGFRVAEAKNTSKSDVKTNWTEIEYDPNTGTNITKNLGEKNAAIYFNKAAFDSQVGKTSIKKKDSGINEIKVTPVSSGKKLYDDHNPSTKDPIAADDIQEMSINLPAIGNMMSDAWDIIHGPNRDNARTDENGSLQGRLDSFRDMNVNAIPVKRAADGTLVSSYINGNTSKNVTDILTETLSESFDSDDAWIKTSINTIGLDNENDLSGIAIHHTFHSVEDTNTTSDINNNGDTINLYTPHVDAAGHVVGKNVETVTLPFGFKTIKTNGRLESEIENASTSPSINNIIADNTQDELNVNSGNKWIRIDTDVNNDSLIISHDIHDTNSTTSEQSLSSETEVTAFEVPTYSFDKAGHYTSHDIKTITMPFSYGKIDGDNGNTEASATFDTLTFGSDEWLTATVEKDKVIYNHDYPKEQDDTTSSFDMNNDINNTIILETLNHDEKGHIINVNQHTVTLPYGYKEFRDSNIEVGKSIADNTQDIFVFKGDSWIKPTVSTDLATFEHIGPVSKVHTSKINVEPKFGETFTIEDHYFDDNGHKYSTETHTVLLPKGSLTDGASNGADVITQLSFIADTGALSSTRTNISELLLTGYEKKDSSNDIANTDTLAQALSKLQTQIHDEEKVRAADDDALRISLGQEIARADAAEKQVLTDAKAYTDQVKKEILIGDSSEALSKTYDTLLEISQWIEGDGVNTTELTAAIAEETKAREENVADINTRIDNLPTYVLSPGETNGSLKLNNSEDVFVTGLGSAAYTDSASYATAEQGALAETALQLDTEFSIPDGDDGSIAVATISQLFAYIRDLQNQVNLLSEEVNRLSAFHPLEDESENI